MATTAQIKELIKRRHPDYERMLPHWDFLEACYRGGRDWFVGNIFPYIKEGDAEYKERIKRAFRFNHTREIADLVNKYIFKTDVLRNDEEASTAVKTFWDSATRNGLNITQYMRLVSLGASTFGRIWIVVDNTAAGKTVQTVADEKKEGIRTYSYFVRPQQVLDLSYDDEGELNWILLYEEARDDVNPLTSSGDMRELYRLWTTDSWYLYEKTKVGRKITYTEIDSSQHDLGIVPVFKCDNVETDEPYSAPALIGDIAYLDRAVANYLSNLDAIIQDQTFSQLAMPAQGVLPGEDAYGKMLEMGTKRIFLYDGENGNVPSYISPDPKQAELIVGVIQQIINEIYHTVGMAGERTKQDNAIGIDNSSGVAKAFDFERVNALLSSKADSLDRVEENLVKIVNLWHGNKDQKADLVKYPDDFDVRGLGDEFSIAENLSTIQAPETARREQMRVLINKLFPRLTEDLKKKMEAELKKWPPAPIIEENSTGDASSATKPTDKTDDGQSSQGSSDRSSDQE
tara:strand:- start:45512 stop:47056 length:1545 start_codon:yes stop_codon:yes gene_type:complete